MNLPIDPIRSRAYSLQVLMGLLALITACVILHGCATESGVKGGLFSREVGEKEEWSLWTLNVKTKQAQPLFPNEKVRKIFLINALDPLDPKKADTGKLVDPRELGNRELYELEYFYQYTLRQSTDNLLKESIDAQKAWRRNLQAALLSMSDSHCARYVSGLQKLQADSGFFFGLASTVLGGLGAIFTPAATARALSGSAGITSGVGAEYHDKMFQDKAASLITKGIESKRDRFYSSRISSRQHLGLADYSLGEAIADAESYHRLCSQVDGLTELEQAVMAQGVGLKRLRETANDLGLNLDFTKKNPEQSSYQEADAALAIMGWAKIKADVERLTKWANDLEVPRSPLPPGVLTTYRTSIVSKHTALKNALAAIDMAGNTNRAYLFYNESRTLLSQADQETDGAKHELIEQKLSAKKTDAKIFLQELSLQVIAFNNSKKEIENMIAALGSPVKLTLKVDQPTNLKVQIHPLAIPLPCSSTPCVHVLPKGVTVILEAAPSHKLEIATARTEGSSVDCSEKFLADTDKTCTVTIK